MWLSILATALLALTLAVAGCGKRPRNLEAPTRADPALYPRTYPAPQPSPVAGQTPIP